ncbi:MAG: hypothetical protein JJ973_01510 [Rhodospirillales bacterium]|nr:hypothetical protein [Rhodospirillales bacterium]
MPSQDQHPRFRGPRKSPIEVGVGALRKFLPASIRHAVQNYRSVAFAEPPSDAKEFQQHQAACKAALQHIEALMKLAASADATFGQRDAGNADTASIVARAEASVDAYSNPKTAKEEKEPPL